MGRQKVSDNQEYYESHLTKASEGVVDAVVRVVATAGRESVLEPLDPSRIVDSASIRVMARVLVGDHVSERSLEDAASNFALDPEGMLRLEAMVRRAVKAEGVDHSNLAIDTEKATRVAKVYSSVLRAISLRKQTGEALHEAFADSVMSIATAQTYSDICQRAAQSALALSRMKYAGIYVAGNEHAVMVSAAATQIATEDSTQETKLGLPRSIRVDRGMFADVVAGERPLYVLGHEQLEAFSPELGLETLIAVPMRDQIGRPLGILLTADTSQRTLEVLSVDALCSLAQVVAGELSGTLIMRRSSAAISTLPKLAQVAHSDDSDVASQLEALARIVVEATESDSAVVRVRDSSGRYLDTRAVTSLSGDSIADIIGSRTKLLRPTTNSSKLTRDMMTNRLRETRDLGMRIGLMGETGARQLPTSLPFDDDLDDAEIGKGQHELVDLAGAPKSWSTAGRRIITELGARSMASYPIESRYGRQGVIYVIRTSSRAFDNTDRACIRIATAHAQHVIDRHVSQQQTARAIDAARSAVRLLGEALVAGVRTDRTMRFVPRLFHEMFASQAVRAWRMSSQDESDITLAASAGMAEHDGPSSALKEALARPLMLELDTRSSSHIAAIAFEGYSDTRIGIEIHIGEGRSLGVEEQRLAVDVASRIQEAIYSAGHAAAQQRQLDRVRALQEIVARSHEQLSEQHVVDTLLAMLPEQFETRGMAVLVVDDQGALSCRGAIDVPTPIVTVLEEKRDWVQEATRGDRAAVTTITAQVNDTTGSESWAGDRLKTVLKEEGLGEHAVAILPLSGREQTLGIVLLVFSGALPEEFREEATTGRGGTLGAFGRQLGAALLNARTFKEERNLRGRTQSLLEIERENARQVRALHEVSRAFANSLSFDETLSAAAEAMADRLDVDAVWIRTLDDRGDHMLMRAFHAGYSELAGALERMVAPPEARDDPVTVEVMQSRRAVLIDNPDSDLWQRSELLQRLRPFLQRGSTVAVLPLMRPGAMSEDVMGTLVMLALDPMHALTYDKIDVATSVTDQAALALDNARLYQQQKSFAEIIQESLLPRRLPDVAEIDYGVLYRSAVVGGDAPQIGGDFYDFLKLEDGRLAMALGDVTGKGVQAAADTAMTKYVFRSLAREHPSPSSFLRYANDVVCDEISPGKFVTLFYAVIDPVRRTFTCGNAGHPEPKLLFPGDTELSDGRVVSSTDPEITSIGMEGLALGILPNQNFEERTYEFPPGASLIVYTDGVVEARREGRLYGQFRLERRIMDESDGGAGQIAYSIYEDCHAYAEHGLNDDVAIVVVRHIP